MARLRSIKPDIMDDEKSAGLSSDAWRLWVCMWMLADDKGRVRCQPKQLEVRVFWGCPVHTSVPDLLEELSARGCIVRYTVKGEPYAEIINFLKHQRIDKPSTWLFPAPSESDGLRDNLRESYGTTTGAVADHSAPEGKGVGVEKEKRDPHRADPNGGVVGLKLDPPDAPRSSTFDFEAVYAAYPKKLGRKKGLQRCRSQITTRSNYDALVRAVKNYSAHVAGKDQQFTKQFDTFMGCWEDWIVAPVAGANGTARPASTKPVAFTGHKFRDEP